MVDWCCNLLFVIYKVDKEEMIFVNNVVNLEINVMVSLLELMEFGFWFCVIW